MTAPAVNPSRVFHFNDPYGSLGSEKPAEIRQPHGEKMAIIGYKLPKLSLN